MSAITALQAVQTKDDVDHDVRLMAFFKEQEKQRQEFQTNIEEMRMEQGGKLQREREIAAQEQGQWRIDIEEKQERERQEYEKKRKERREYKEKREVERQERDDFWKRSNMKFQAKLMHSLKSDKQN